MPGLHAVNATRFLLLRRLRIVLYHLQEAVRSKFPSSTANVIGGFLFLRFLCPSMLIMALQQPPQQGPGRGLFLAGCVDCC